MDLFLHVAERLESLGYPCPIRSAGGTATWRLSAEREGVTEIQAGTYVVMDNFHGQMVPDFETRLDCRHDGDQPAAGSADRRRW